MPERKLSARSSCQRCRCLIEAEDKIDGALPDVNLGNEAIWSMVDMLLARGVPLVLATGYDASAIPKAYAHLPRCEKPAKAKYIAWILASQLHAMG